MFKTVDEAADVVTDIFIEKMANGFMEGLKGLGGKALGGLRSAGNYMVNKGPNTLHSALGGNDAAHWGALGAIGLGGLGAAKGLVAPDEGKGRVRSMISNAALGALMGGAGGGAAGMAIGDNPILRSGGNKKPSTMPTSTSSEVVRNIMQDPPLPKATPFQKPKTNMFGGLREEQKRVADQYVNVGDRQNVEAMRAGLGPVGAVAASTYALDPTGVLREAARPAAEALNSPIQTPATMLGSALARRAWQHHVLDKNTPANLSIPREPGVNWIEKTLGKADRFRNAPLKTTGDFLYQLGSGTTKVDRTINRETLQDAYDTYLKRMGINPAVPAPPLSPMTIPPGATTASINSVPSMGAAPSAVPAGALNPPASLPRINSSEVLNDLEKMVNTAGGSAGKGSSGGGKALSDIAQKNLTGFQGNQMQDLRNFVDSPEGRAAFEDAIRNQKELKFRTSTKLPGMRFGGLGWQLGGQHLMSHMRNLPKSVDNLIQLADEKNVATDAYHQSFK